MVTGSTESGDKQLDWAKWSAEETKRLVALPLDELITTIKDEDALDNLTPHDKTAIFKYMTGQGWVKPKRNAGTVFRKPDPITGNAPVGPPNRDPRKKHPYLLPLGLGLIGLIAWTGIMIVACLSYGS